MGGGRPELAGPAGGPGARGEFGSGYAVAAAGVTSGGLGAGTGAAGVPESPSPPPTLPASSSARIAIFAASWGACLP